MKHETRHEAQGKTQVSRPFYTIFHVCSRQDLNIYLHLNVKTKRQDTSNYKVGEAALGTSQYLTCTESLAALRLDN